MCLKRHYYKHFPGGSDGKASVYNVGDLGSIPGSGRFPGEGNGNPLQYSCLENPMDGGAWCRLLSMGSQSRARLTDFTSLHFTTNKASGGDGNPDELFQILKDDTVKIHHSTCQQIWKTQMWAQD